MINANELRIGNWVALKDGYFVPIADGGILAINQKRFECYPISLTPEILEKCGFVSNPYQDRYEFGDIHVEYCGFRDICWVNGKPHIEYLHQLQNLYFALTNEELNYTP